MNTIYIWKNVSKEHQRFGILVFFTLVLWQEHGLNAANVLIRTNFTQRQFAALGLIGSSAFYLEMAVTQLVINLRYCLMSCSLAQKMDPGTAFAHRFLLAFGITDEIFGVSVCREGRLSPFYNYGLMSISMPGWVLGTFCGVVSGSLLPERIISALSIALYGMFIAVIIPPAKENRLLAAIILLSMLLSFLLRVSFLSDLVRFQNNYLTLLIAG